MGHGYAILLWDGWGSGLVRLNARLHIEGDDIHGNPKNWWSCDENDTDADLLARRGLTPGPGNHCLVIRG